MTRSWQRRYPIGAEVVPQGGVHFRVWAPGRQKVAVIGEGSQPALLLEPEGNGYFSGGLLSAGNGFRYRFQMDEDAYLYPDPASRFQPDGVHGPSQVVDPSFRWTDDDWQGVSADGNIIYEMHLGTFTPEGTWHAARRELAELKALGITMLEVMPITEFPGSFGWGYDGVDLFAPTRLYGSPDSFRDFVNHAHALGLAVILDVVYNHLGPDGNYLSQFSPHYFSRSHETEWGQALNFDGAESGPVREFFQANARYWIDEYHLDGLRLDATQSIFDDSPTHILAEISREVRLAAGNRSVYLVAENEPQHSKLARPRSQGGYGLDALWNDDFHHSAAVALTGHTEAYYTDYAGHPQEFLTAAKYGYLFQGQRYAWQKKKRGTPALDLPPQAFVTFLQNHDQVANSGHGLRCHQLTSPGKFRAMTALLLLLGPSTPMLFQGQEFAASAPFFYFADHHEELSGLVAKGRGEFLTQFGRIATPEIRASLQPPHHAESFQRSKLDLGERQRHAAIYDLHRDLIHLRQNDDVFKHPRRGGVDGFVIGSTALAMRFFGKEHGDRLMLVNFGNDLTLPALPDPLSAAPEDCAWKVLWSSECLKYGGAGTPPPESDLGWFLPAASTVVLTSVKGG